MEKQGLLKSTFNKSGKVTYELEVWHEGLHKHRLIRATDARIAKRQAEEQLARWREQWTQKQTTQRKRESLQHQAQMRDEKKLSAIEQTEEAQRVINDLQKILYHTLGTNPTVDWEALKTHSAFPIPKPSNPVLPAPKLAILPDEPQANDPQYQPALGLLDKLFSPLAESKRNKLKAAFEQDHQQWEKDLQAAKTTNSALQKEFEERAQKLNAHYEPALRQWEAERANFLSQQQSGNEAVDRQKAAYLAGDSEAILEYCDMVLSNSKYPDYFPQEHELDYDKLTKVLVVDYALPPVENLPTLIEVKYVQARDEFTEKHLSQAQIHRVYDDVIYQIALRTMYELYKADLANVLEVIVFNGWVQSIDKATGREIRPCILSLEADRKEFLSINLANVEPKACFKSLKGVSSSKLHSLAAVAPIIKINRDDARFVSSYAVADYLDDSYNLAAMDWEDFEHLIREVFEKEFSYNGGEVKVTQASRDGGVDAVAFDPDPIRGGKIVIQAKRYTNAVGVSAVRDLYGTVMNEGATKGILVTTADYGPDAYAFAKGKPLTLLNGANLLHLLEKHGHKARIDLQEAKNIAASRTNKRH